MVPVSSILAMAVTLVICFVVPVGGLAFLGTRRDDTGARRHPGLGRAFGAGMLAFGVSQLLVRIPLLTFVVPQLPEPIKTVLLSAPMLSLTAGLFEETARLVFMVWLLRRYHRWADGVAFGLGHGGLEAMALVGLSMVNNIVLSIAINAGRLDALAGALPADQVDLIRSALVETESSAFLLGGVERLAAMAFHVGLSVLVLWGVHRSRRLAAWLIAVLTHAVFNLSLLLVVGTGISLWAVEGIAVAWGIAAVLLVIRLRPAFAATIAPDPRTLPAPRPDDRRP